MGTAIRAAGGISAAKWSLSGAEPFEEASEPGPLGSIPTRSEAGGPPQCQTHPALEADRLRLGLAWPFGGIPEFNLLGDKVGAHAG